MNARYVLMAPNNTFYTGRAGIYANSVSKAQAYTYGTEDGARYKQKSSAYFRDYRIVKL